MAKYYIIVSTHNFSAKKKALKDSLLPNEVKIVKQQVMNYQYKKKLRKCDKEIIRILDMKVSNIGESGQISVSL